MNLTEAVNHYATVASLLEKPLNKSVTSITVANKEKLVLHTKRSITMMKH